MIAALYVRISTHEGKQHVENQLLELRRFAVARGWTIYREYVDERTGSRSDRDDLIEMMKDAHLRRFDVVLVWALDRLTKEGVLPTFDYLAKLKQAGVEFHSLTEPHFTTSGPLGELFIILAAWIAKQENARIRERVRAGLARARANGVHVGRKKKVFDVHKARALQSAGVSLQGISDRLNVPKATVQRRIKQL